MKYLGVAFNLLTTLPIPAPRDWAAGDSGRAAPWYPLVGAVLGALLSGLYFLLARVFPPLVCAALLTAFWVGLTGALHLDGLADCCDGLFYPGRRERRLEIMKDPHHGTFGMAGLVLALVLRFAALAVLPQARVIPALFLAPVFARWILLPAGRQPLAREGGMGADFAAGLHPLAPWLTALLPILPALFLGWHGVAALALALLIAAAWLFLARRRIGGVTGDVFGLLVESSEITILLFLSITI